MVGLQERRGRGRDLSDTGGLAGAVVVLGFIVLLANLVVPNTAWTDFVDAAQATPTFDNPFDERYEVDLNIVGDGSIAPASSADNAAVADCDTSADPGPGTDWWGCVNTPDGADSTASTDGVETEFKVELGAAAGLSGNLPVLAIRTMTQCNAAAAVIVDYLFFKSDDVTLIAEIPTEPFRCDSYNNGTVYSYFVTPHAIVSDYNNGVVLFNPEGGGNVASFSYLRVTLIVGADVECSSADTLAYIGCIIGGFFNFLIRGVRTIVSALIFVAQGFVYLGSMVVAFFGLFAVVFTLGAPSPYQEFIDVAVIAILVYMVVAFLKILRGAGPI